MKPPLIERFRMALWDEHDAKDADKARTMTLGNGLVFEVRRASFDRLQWIFILWLETAAKDRRVEIVSWEEHGIVHIEDALPIARKHLRIWLNGLIAQL